MNKANSWLEVEVLAHRLDAEAVAAVLEPFSPGGIAIEEPIAQPQSEGAPVIDPHGRVAVRAYLPESTAPRWPSLRRRLRRLPLSHALRTRSRWLDQDDWAHAWKEFFPVLRVGRRLVIRPSWRDYTPAEGDVVIHVDPGMAFGTGQHPTTRLCLEALEELAWPGMRALDLGTGSGILAIAAARLGAALVLALDIDPQAVRATRENARLNGVAELVVAEVGSLGEAWPVHLSVQCDFDLLLANISGLTICDLAPELARALRPGGVAVVSGFTADGAQAVARSLEAAALCVERSLAADDWGALVAREG